MGFIEFSENDDGIKDLPDDATETRLSLVSPKVFFSILSQREFWFRAAVASGLLSRGHLISSDYRKFDFTDTI